MNFGTQSIVYRRRKAQYTRSSSNYINMRLDSLGSIESEEDWEASSSSAMSTKSSKSMRSFKSWKRAQREKRRNLKRAQTLGLDASERTLVALDLSGEHGTPIDRPRKLDRNVLTRAKAIDIEESKTIPAGDGATALSAIAQSPLDPYYSSSPLTTSSDESGPPESPHRILSELDERAVFAISDRTREPYQPQKELFSRRSYPFILPDIYQHERTDVTEEEASRYKLPPTKDEEKKRSVSASGLNSVSSLVKTAHRRSSLLTLALQSRNPSMEEPAYDETGGEKDVVFSDQNDFTIAMPVHSPSVPSHMLDGPEGHHDDNATMENEQKENKSEEEGRKNETQNDMKENKETKKRYDVANQEHFFLPPLIARALSNKALEDGNISQARDKNSNLKMSPLAGANLNSTGSSTEEEFEEENVYMENAEDIFDDLVEKDFLGVPRRPAVPENVSDDGSAVTQGSVDPIENILTREDDVTADDKTFTLNGRAVITPKLAEERKGLEKTEKEEGAQEETKNTDSDTIEKESEVSTEEHASSGGEEPKSGSKKQADVTDFCPGLCCAIL